MASAAQTTGIAPPRGRWMFWTGLGLSAVPVLMMLFSASMKLSHAARFVDMWTGKFGYPEGLLSVIGVLELACVVVYAIPRTAILGAVLLTGYLGGAIATHVRIGDPGFTNALVLGILVWAGLFLRDARVRALLPLRAVAAKP